MNQTNLRSVSFKWLILFYAIIPVCGLLVIIDYALLDRSLAQQLPYTPQSLFLFAIFFGLPHIMASNLIMVRNRQYMAHFKHQIAIASLAIISFLILANTVLSYNTVYFIYAAVTIVHVLKQQFGLSRAIGGLSGISYNIWMYSGIIAGVAIYTAVFMYKVLPSSTLTQLKMTAWVSTTIYVASGIFLHQKARPGIGRAYLWANTLMIPAALFFYLSGYTFFTILCPRIVHDCTAFSIYINHDRNQHKTHAATESASSGAYRYLVWLGLAIALAYALNNLGAQLSQLSFGLLTVENGLLIAVMVKTYLELMHYYMESVTWKNGSPYRQYVRFTA